MSKIATLVLFLSCCTVWASAQNGAGPASDPQKVHVSAEALTGMVEHKSLPQYPKQALLNGIQGDVVFEVQVDENGKIVSSDAVKGDPVLVAASKDALKDYRFRPYVVDGAPVGFKSELGYHFSLSQKGDETGGTVECMFTVP